VTVVLAVAVLFDKLGSVVDVDAVALFVMVRGKPWTVIEIVNVAVPLDGIVPSDAVGVAPPLHVPWLTVQEVKVVDAGSVSTTVELAAAAPPLLTTVMV